MRKWREDQVAEWKRMRLAGQSYKDISSECNVSKSTLSYWLKGTDDNNWKFLNKEQWVRVIQPMGAMANKKNKERKSEEINKKVAFAMENFRFSELAKKSLLGMLYWAEGAKGRSSGVCFANTDPLLIQLFISLLRECFHVKEEKFRIRLHLHYYHNERSVKEYWSRITGVPAKQFTKSYRKKRGTNKIFRKNSYGICFLLYHSIDLKDEIMAYAKSSADRLIVSK